jgi:hypothetical protein
MSKVKRPKTISSKKVLVLNDVRSGLMQHYLPKTIHDVITFDLIFSILYFRPLNFRCFTICFHFTLTKNGLSTREALMQEQLQSHFVGIFFRFFPSDFFQHFANLKRFCLSLCSSNGEFRFNLSFLAFEDKS